MTQRAALELFRIGANVASAEERDDTVRSRIEHSRQYVKVLIVMYDTKVGFKTRLGAWLRFIFRNLSITCADCHAGSPVLPSSTGATAVQVACGLPPGWRLYQM